MATLVQLILKKQGLSTTTGLRFLPGMWRERLGAPTPSTPCLHWAVSERMRDQQQWKEALWLPNTTHCTFSRFGRNPDWWISLWNHGRGRGVFATISLFLFNCCKHTTRKRRGGFIGVLDDIYECTINFTEVNWIGTPLNSWMDLPDCSVFVLLCVRLCLQFSCSDHNYDPSPKCTQNCYDNACNWIQLYSGFIYGDKATEVNNIY